MQMSMALPPPSSRLLLLLTLYATLQTCHFALPPSPHVDDPEDIDFLELDLDDPEPSHSFPSSPSSLVSSALQKKSLFQLSDSTTASFLAANEYVLLLGFAPWCISSSEIMPEFAAAAILIQEAGIPVSLARIDAVANPRSASELGIKGFPTILFFSNGTSESYTGGFLRENFVTWIKKHTGTPAITISSKDQVDEILKQERVLVVGFFHQFKGPEYEAFISVAMEEEETEFIQVDRLELAGRFNGDMNKSPPFLSILKNEEEKYVAFEDDFEKSKIRWFVEVNKHPLVMKIQQNNYMRLYKSPVKLHMTLLADNESSAKLARLFRDVAKTFKGQILFLMADVADEELSRPTLSLFGLDADKPAITAFNYDNGLKYLFESNLTLETLEGFCHQLVNGQLLPYYKSQPIPSENEGGLQIVVGKSFESVVFDKSRDVFLEVYSQWCTRCDAANKAIEALAKYFMDVSGLVIAKIDAGANEHPLLQVDDYPSFIFFPANNKTNPILAPKKWTTKKLLQFIHEHATVPLVSPPRTAKDEL